MASETLVLNGDIALKVQQRVQSGRFCSSDDVVAAALDALDLKESEDEEKIVALRKAIDEGFASGIAPGSIDEVFERAKQRALTGIAS